MKTLACIIIALAGFVLSSALCAAREDDGEITGTVVRVNGQGEFEVDDGKGAFALVPAFEGSVPKVGTKVRVHYYHCGSGRKGFHHCADKIEKLGNGQVEPAKDESSSAKASGGKSKLSDAQIKQKLIGYWKSPRHGYLIKDDGIIYMLPRKYASTTNHWRVQNGLFYWDDIPNDIITLDDKKCIYRSRGGRSATFTLIRSTKEEADPD